MSVVIDGHVSAQSTKKDAFDEEFDLAKFLPPYNKDKVPTAEAAEDCIITCGWTCSWTSTY